MKNIFKRKARLGIANLILIGLQFLIYYFISSLFLKKEEYLYICAEFLIFLVLMFYEEIYNHKSHLFWNELKKLIRVHVLFFLILIIFKSVYSWDKFLILKEIFSVLVFLSFNILLIKINRRLGFKLLKKNLVIIGVAELGAKLTRIIDENMFTMYDIKGYIQYRDNVNFGIEKNKIHGKISDITTDYFNDVDEVIVAVEDISEKELTVIVNKVDGKVRKIKYIPKINGLFTFDSEAEDYDGLMLITAGQHIKSIKRKIIKRLFDIVGGIAGCFLLIPLTIYVWLKTSKEERKNGIFFSQDRIGRDGKTIKIYKYRSMVVNAEKILEDMLKNDKEIREEYNKTKKLKNDPRVTEIGLFLRRTSLDEFPQLLNVLKGEMSLIGPRPYLHREIQDMGDSYNKIIKFKPAITGIWQVNGRNDIDFDGRLVLDEYYFRNWSIWLDIVILIKTIKQVVARKGAY